ncbi:MAG: hypothetical protein MK193_13695 [Lentisphaeria bacterium]|nr:hypothetical protein [Lentisphaeria bacterium]
MNIKSLKTIINQKLICYLEPVGFKHRMSDFTYIQQKTGYSNLFGILVTKRPDYFLIQISIGFSVPSVNKILDSQTNLEAKTNSSTFSFSVHNKYQNRGRYYYEGYGDQVINEILKDFELIAKPLFTSLHSLGDLEGWLEGNIPISPSTIASRIILSQMLGSDQSQNLINQYQPQYEKQHPDTVLPFIQILEYYKVTM